MFPDEKTWALAHENDEKWTKLKKVFLKKKVGALANLSKMLDFGTKKRIFFGFDGFGSKSKAYSP